jgi:hypothetical protein
VGFKINKKLKDKKKRQEIPETMKNTRWQNQTYQLYQSRAVTSARSLNRQKLCILNKNFMYHRKWDNKEGK